MRGEGTDEREKERKSTKFREGALEGNRRGENKKKKKDRTCARVSA